MAMSETIQNSKHKTIQSRRIKLCLFLMCLIIIQNLAYLLFDEKALFFHLSIVIGLALGWFLSVLGLCFHKSYPSTEFRWRLGFTLALTFILYIVTIGPVNPSKLREIRLKTIIKHTGGFAGLQSWSMNQLEECTNFDPNLLTQWYIPKEKWSDQVTHLKPQFIRVRPMFEQNQPGVCLMYGSKFNRWMIVIGPPDSIPQQSSITRQSKHWIEWTDNIYYTQSW